MLTFGWRTRQTRVALKITQKTLAKSLEVHTNTISAIERGLLYPGLILGIRVAETLGVCVYYLMGLSENPRRPVQFDTDQDEQNYRQYKKMSTAERKQFAEFCGEFLLIQSGTTGKREKAF